MNSISICNDSAQKPPLGSAKRYDKYMIKNETQFTAETAMAAVNALKASTEGFHDVAEQFAPGFAAYFFRHTASGRKAIMADLMAALTVAA